jgi:hypothetical protein
MDQPNYVWITTWSDPLKVPKIERAELLEMSKAYGAKIKAGDGFTWVRAQYDRKFFFSMKELKEYLAEHLRHAINQLSIQEFNCQNMLTQLACDELPILDLSAMLDGSLTQPFQSRPPVAV